MDENAVDVSMETNEAEGTVTFTVKPPEAAVLVGSFLALGMDRLQSLSDEDAAADTAATDDGLVN